MNQSKHRADAKPSILYLRTGIVVLDRECATAEASSREREWDIILALNCAAAFIGCIIGLLLQ